MKNHPKISISGAFGSLLENRNFNSEKYRFGWNKGSEKDDEITGITGSHITTYFREFDTRLARTWSLDPVFQPWQSSYSSMDNNPILYNDPLGDKVKIRDSETRKSIRAARKSDAGFNQQFKDWRKEKGHTYVFEKAQGENNGLYTAVRDILENGKHTANSTIVQFDLINGGFAGTKDGGISKVNPLGTPDISTPAPDLDINTQSRNGIPALPPPVPPINVTVSAPFVPGNATFSNPATATTQLQNAANTFLRNPNASQLTITIGTDVMNINQSAPNDPTVRQLLNRRGRQVRNILQGMGIPSTAIAPIQLAPVTTIGTTIQVR